MSKIFNFYNNNVDKTWYQSTNIIYSECIDEENKFKTLTVVFKNGTQYRYENVNVFDYLRFRDADSQGKGLNEFIKGKNYKFTKLENADLEKINEEYSYRTGNNLKLKTKDNGFALLNSKDEILLDYKYQEDDSFENVIEKVLNSVGYIVNRE